VTATALVGGRQPVGAAPRQASAPLDERVAAIVKSSHREVEQAREVRAEELIERALVAGSHALNDLNVIHIEIRACVGYRQFRHRTGCRASCL
jgi:hypothetical protein